MLDLLGIVVSTSIMMVIVIRALMLDRSLPWIEHVVPAKDKPPGRGKEAPPAPRSRSPGR